MKLFDRLRAATGRFAPEPVDYKPQVASKTLMQENPDGSVSPKVELTYDLPNSLDELWLIAEKFGTVEFSSGERDFRHDKLVYSASINSTTDGGSRIYAKGKGQSPHEAIRNAIVEARALYAGYLLAKK